MLEGSTDLLRQELTIGSRPVRSTKFSYIKEHMSRITSQKAAEMVGNRFDLVLIAAARARELKKGHLPKVNSKNGPTITALREIEEGKIGREYLKKIFDHRRETK